MAPSARREAVFSISHLVTAEVGWMMPELKNEHIWSEFRSFFISCSSALCVRQTSTDKV